MFRICRGTVLVAHPAAFDVPFIQTQAKVWKLPPLPLTYVDSRGLAFALKKERKIALDDLLEEYQLFSHSRHHALNDALMTGYLFLELQKHPSLSQILEEEDLHWYIRKES
ncbi:3'-5' exonuclease [Mangrovibacillus cuniculi]|uniref:3'-5' exonuclease n=1 Tax=Mangrovibacillus cuniculi TaxID=2593652 RepID=A0A7S8CE91_9BACI|nr:3'-5' exonuclease [Mangrovibacillus cuniculi]